MMRASLRSTASVRLLRLLAAAVLAGALSGCMVYTVADAAVSVAATAVKVTAKAVGAVADAVIPDGDDKKKD